MISILLTGSRIAPLLIALPLTLPALAQRPNIIYIMTDDHATQMMSAYGPSPLQTPNLDRIGAEGALFTNSFCTNSLCAPARATVLTGKYSHKNGQLGNRGAFNGKQVTFPKLLQQAGYQTAIVGKWHLKSTPTGFDYHNVLPGQGDYRDPVLIEMGEPKKHTGYVTDVITDLAMRWIRNRDTSKPFMLMYHHKAPHAQWVPDAKHEPLFADEDIPLPDDFHDDLTGRTPAVQKATNRLVPHTLGRWRTWGAKLGKEDPGDLTGDALNQWMYQQYVKDYMRVMTSVDQNVGRLLDFLDDNNLTDNTLIIYTSDNGMFIGDHFLFDKRLMHEESLRIPLVIRYPKAIKPGTRLDEFALNVDYAPTMLDYAGVDIPDHMQGRSLKPLLKGDTPNDWRDSFYYHYYEDIQFHFQDVVPHYGLRTDRYKLIHYYPTGQHTHDEWELIDLKNDPNELTNIYEDPAQQSTIRELKAELVRQRQAIGVTTQ
ncbi:MAG: sulfatase family protein [Planctomycetota bacterium]|jgi:arylsulfatase A-like enzyme